MKILRWVSVVLISVGGLVTIIAFGIIMNGISDPAVYNTTLTIGKVTNVVGKYKVIINGSNGYAYESSEYTDVDMIFTTTNAKANVTYTVTIVNTGS